VEKIPRLIGTYICYSKSTESVINKIRVCEVKYRIEYFITPFYRSRRADSCKCPFFYKSVDDFVNIILFMVSLVLNF